MRETHERNVLVWLAAAATGRTTRVWRWLILSLALVFLSVLMGCGGGSSTTGSKFPELTHPNELMMQALITCNADHHGRGEIKLSWFRGERRYFTTANGKLGFAACGAWPGANYVECDHAWVLQAQRAELADAAAHEVCHITGDLQEPPAACRDKAMETCK